MLGLGIDTGGTCTDAVIYDLGQGQVLSVGKTLTTKEQLESGIENAIEMLEESLLKQVSFVSLSTTLATNACVENRGGRVKLLFIGIKPAIVSEVYKEYGFESMDDLLFMEGVPEGGFCKAVSPDWEQLRAMAGEFKDAEAIGIVQYFPEWNNGRFEKKAKEILEKYYKVPIICGSELFSDINAIRRGAGTYLNIRLIPIIRVFLDAVKHVLEKKQLEIPVYVVRSDGTLMNEDFTKNHPVETLLCGPAASALGGAWMANKKDALIVDIGGTTTDIAIMQNEKVLTVADGIKINGWKTFVKGMYIDTFGLGGDSAVRYNQQGIYLENFRVIPIAMAADRYPELIPKLKELINRKKRSKEMLHEGFILQKEISTNESYTEEQIIFCEELKRHPLLLEEAYAVCGKYHLERCISRLEQENIIMRFGLTPTDMMHIKGDYCAYNGEASKAALECMAFHSGIPRSKIPDLVYQAFTKKLCCNIIRVLLEKGSIAYADGLPHQLIQFISESYDGNFDGFIKHIFKSDMSIIGVGGPAPIFMHTVGDKLHTEIYVHENANVANAIGTLAGQISVTEALEMSYCSEDEKEGYRIFIDGQKKIMESFDAAVTEIKQYLEDVTKRKSMARGAVGEIHWIHKIDKYETNTGSNTLLLGGKVSVTAYGNIAL